MKKQREKRNTEFLSVRMTPELKREVEKAAASDRRTSSEFVRMLIEDYFKVIPSQDDENTT